MPWLGCATSLTAVFCLFVHLSEQSLPSTMGSGECPTNSGERLMSKKDMVLVKVEEGKEQEAIDAAIEATMELLKEQIRQDPATFAGSNPQPGGLLDQALKEVAEESGPPA